jgi:hypothetical protein
MVKITPFGKISNFTATLKQSKVIVDVPAQEWNQLRSFLVCIKILLTIVDKDGRELELLAKS